MFAYTRVACVRTFLALLHSAHPHTYTYTHTSQSNQKDEFELNEFRKKVEKYRLQTLGMAKDHESHRHFATMRDELLKRTQRVEMIVLKKITTDHSDSTFAEFKTVLQGILENAWFESSLQRAFHSCLAGDMYDLKKAQLQASQQAMCPVATGNPPFTASCSACKTPLSEAQNVVSYMCGHVFHEACVEERDGAIPHKCTACFGRARPAPGTKADSKAGGEKTAETRSSERTNRKLLQRMDTLNRRLKNRGYKEFLVTLDREDAGAGDGGGSAGGPVRGLPMLDTAPAGYDPMLEEDEEEAETLRRTGYKDEQWESFDEEIMGEDLTSLLDVAISCGDDE